MEYKSPSALITTVSYQELNNPVFFMKLNSVELIKSPKMANGFITETAKMLTKITNLSNLSGLKILIG